MGFDPGPSEPPGSAGGLAHAADVLRRHERGRALRRGLRASALTVGALILAAELGLRLSHDRRRFFEASVNKTNRRWVALTTAGIFEELDDPVRRYAMRPLAEARIEGWTFRVSSHRTRGPDFPREKPPGEKRLLCLGDSFCFGLWCDEEETLAGHLARAANAGELARGSGSTWRALDLGVPGYHAGQCLAALEQDGLALAPDVVVYYFNSNDIEQEGFFFDPELGVLRRDFLPLPARLRRWLWHSHLYGWIAAKVRNAIDDRPSPQFDPSVPYAFVRADNQAATRAALARMAELCAARGIPFFLVDQPLLTWQGDAQRADWVGAELVRWAEGVRAELGIPGISLLGLWRGWSDGVDRQAGLAPGAPLPEHDFLLDAFCADERIQAAVAFARAEAAREQRDWDALPYEEQKAYVARYRGEIPAEPDFHLTGAGYGAIAQVVYPALRAAGILP